VQQRVAKLQAELKTARAGLRESVQLELEQVTESAAALQRVIDVAAGHDGDVAVVDDAGAVIGTIGKGRLLRALRDGR
jgi:glucose/arabinose dehydrogenase